MSGALEGFIWEKVFEIKNNCGIGHGILAKLDGTVHRHTGPGIVPLLSDHHFCQGPEFYSAIHYQRPPSVVLKKPVVSVRGGLHKLGISRNGWPL